MGDLGRLAVIYLYGRVRMGDLTRGSAATHRSTLLSFAATYSDRPVRRLNRRDIERWMEQRGHLMASTRRANISVLRQFTSWLVREGHVVTDPMAQIRSPKQPRTTPRAMPAGDIATVLELVPDSRARAVIALQVGLGLRCIEVSRVRIEDWNRRDQLLRVTGKGGHERELPVPHMVARHLVAYLTEHPATVGPLIRSQVNGYSGIKPATISTLVSGWMSDAGVKLTARDGVSAHALRHTAASDILDECGDLRIVQQVLGHRQLSTTSIYLRRVDLPKMRDAMEGRSYRPAV